MRKILFKAELGKLWIKATLIKMNADSCDIVVLGKEYRVKPEQIKLT